MTNNYPTKGATRRNKRALPQTAPKDYSCYRSKHGSKCTDCYIKTAYTYTLCGLAAATGEGWVEFKDLQGKWKFKPGSPQFWEYWNNRRRGK